MLLRCISLLFLAFVASFGAVHAVQISGRFIRSNENINTSLTHEYVRNLDVNELDKICESYYSSSNNSIPPEPAEVVDISEWVDTWNETNSMVDRNDTKIKQNWRTSPMTVAQLNRAILKYSIMTDCTFLIGPTQDKLHAHRLILARSSPVFEAMFTAQNATSHPVLKVPDDVPFKTFAQMVDFLYTGEACINDFDDACELSKVAAKFRLMDLAEYTRMFLWRNIYPDNIWRAFLCAEKVKDDKLTDMALEFANVNMKATLKDPKFIEISQDTLVALLKKPTLNVESELQVVDASLRWAMAEVTRRGLPPGPESMRTALGPALSHLRFLALTPTQFANMQSTAKLLTYTESMTVIFNLNSPGISIMPHNLSRNSNQRNSKTQNMETYFDVFGSRLSCPSSDLFKPDIFDFYTLQRIDISASDSYYYNSERTPILLGIQIPTQIECNHFQTYEEDFIVAIFTSFGYYYRTPLYSESFHMRVSCKSLLTVKFSQEVRYTAVQKQSFSIKVILQKSGKYPRYWNSNDKRQPATKNLDGSNEYFWEFSSNNFIYSVITPNKIFKFETVKDSPQNIRSIHYETERNENDNSDETE